MCMGDATYYHTHVEKKRGRGRDGGGARYPAANGTRPLLLGLSSPDEAVLIKTHSNMEHADLTPTLTFPHRFSNFDFFESKKPHQGPKA